MKTNKQLAMILLAISLMVTGIVYGDDPVKGSGTSTSTSGSGTGLGWQEHTKRTPTLYNDGLRISTGPSVGLNGISWMLSFSSNFVMIECCKYTTLVQSWCNFNVDDPRCAD